MLSKRVMDVIFFYDFQVCYIISVDYKGIIETLRKLCYRFFQQDKKEQFTIPWIKWQLQVRTNREGAWGLKILSSFSIIGCKIVWRLIYGSELYKSVTWRKYIYVVEDWKRKSKKNTLDVSVFWGALTFASPPIEKFLAYKIGDVLYLRLGTRNSIGSGNSCILLYHMIHRLRCFGYTNKIIWYIYST